MPRRNEYDAHRQRRETRHAPRLARRSDDIDRRPLWYAVAIVAVLVALWWTR